MKDFLNLNKTKFAINIVLFYLIISLLNLFFLFINSFGKSIVYEDSFTLLYDNKSNFYLWLFKHHNGHIISISKSITSFFNYISLNPTGYNISISIFILLIGIFIIYKIINVLIKDSNLKKFTFYYCVFLWISPFQWENLLWEFQIPWFLISFLVLLLTLINVLEFKNIVLNPKYKNLFFILSPIIAVLSSGQGICYVGCLFITFFIQKKKYKISFIGIPVSIFLFVFLRKDYDSNLDLNFINNIQYIFLMLNSTFKPSITSFNRESFIDWIIPTISTFIFNLILLKNSFFKQNISFWRKNLIKYVPLCIPIIYGMQFVILTSFSRNQFGIHQGVVSRYLTSLNLVPIGLIIISAYFFSKELEINHEKNLKSKYKLNKNFNFFIFSLAALLIINSSSIFKTITETKIIYNDRQENFEKFINICKLNENEKIEDQELLKYQQRFKESVAVNIPPLPRAKFFGDFKEYVNSDLCELTVNYF